MLEIQSSFNDNNLLFLLRVTLDGAFLADAAAFFRFDRRSIAIDLRETERTADAPADRRLTRGIFGDIRFSQFSTENEPRNKFLS